MSSQLGTLVVVVIKARHLPNKQKIGKQDPYCVVLHATHRERTKPIKRGGQNPTWDEQFKFAIFENSSGQVAAVPTNTGGVMPIKNPLPTAKPDNKRELRFLVYADDPKDPELIGEATVDIAPTLKKGEFDEWINLSNKGKYAGELYVEMTFYSAKPPPAPLKPRPLSAMGNGTYGGPGSYEPPFLPSSASTPNVNGSLPPSLRPGTSSLKPIPPYSPKPSASSSAPNDFGKKEPYAPNPDRTNGTYTPSIYTETLAQPKAHSLYQQVDMDALNRPMSSLSIAAMNKPLPPSLPAPGVPHDPYTFQLPPDPSPRPNHEHRYSAPAISYNQYDSPVSPIQQNFRPNSLYVQTTHQSPPLPQPPYQEPYAPRRSSSYIPPTEPYSPANYAQPTDYSVPQPNRHSPQNPPYHSPSPVHSPHNSTYQPQQISPNPHQYSPNQPPYHSPNEPSYQHATNHAPEQPYYPPEQQADYQSAPPIRHSPSNLHQPNQFSPVPVQPSYSQSSYGDQNFQPPYQAQAPTPRPYHSPSHTPAPYYGQENQGAPAPHRLSVSNPAYQPNYQPQEPYQPQPNPPYQPSQSQGYAPSQGYGQPENYSGSYQGGNQGYNQAPYEEQTWVSPISPAGPAPPLPPRLSSVQQQNLVGPNPANRPLPTPQAAYPQPPQDYYQQEQQYGQQQYQQTYQY